MDLQIGVFDVERQREAFALDGAGERSGDVEIERVAELIGFRSPAGLDASGEVAGVVASEAGFAERAEQIAERFEAEEVEAFVGYFKFCMGCVFSGLPAHARLAGRIMRLID